MINFFRKRKRKSNELLTNISKYSKSRSGEDLLNTPERKQLIYKIKRLLSITNRVWEEHYLQAIISFSEYAQTAPASEYHHHNYHGGLIDHTLEALFQAIKASHGFILPPNTAPENIAASVDKWRFAVFITILAHDIGKIVTDIEFVYKEKKTGNFVVWYPWGGPIPISAEYSFRYRDKINIASISKSLHEQAGISLLPKLLTKKAGAWIFSDLELLSQILSTISNNQFGGGVIYKILKIADMGSVRENLAGDNSAQTTFESNKSGLHEKIIKTLRVIANDGSLKRNIPGAALWVTEEYTWVVSKATMKTVKEILLEEGHKGIPRSEVRFFAALNENDLIEKTEGGDSVWKAEINDYGRNWKQKLTFLKFKNETIWLSVVPSVFDGTVTPVNVAKSKEVKEVKEIKNTIITPDNVSLKTNEDIAEKKEGGNLMPVNEEVKVVFTHPPASPEEIDFFNWILISLKSRKLRANEPKSPIHFTNEYMLLVTPIIFIKYLQSNPLKQKMYASKTGTDRAFTSLQKEVESLGIHKKSLSGTNMIKVSVNGVKSSSSFTAYALGRGRFPELNSFSENKAISIEE